MIKKAVMVCVVIVLVIVLAGVAGCTSANPSNPSTASAPTAQSTTTPTTAALPTAPPTNIQSYTGPFVGSKNSNVYHYPWCSEAKKIKSENLVVFATVADACAANYRPCEVCKPPACTPSSTPAPTATPTPTQLPTQATISGPASVAQGQAITFTTALQSVNEHKNVCGAVNYYIDDQAAGGTWNINPAGTCSASSGSLSLIGTDTAKLSVGTHTLKIDWLGDSTYGPSQSSEQFTVTSPTPTPTPLIQLVGDSATHVYHLPSCSWVHLISPAHLVYFSSAAEAEAAGYRPCEHCHPPT
jgi:methylphosphotriester-DNA--protein-cysteine methyltransferase